MNRLDDLEAVVLAELGDRVRSRYNATKAVAGVDLADGDKRTVRSPLDGSRLGTISRSDPDPRWEITDRRAFETHLVGDDSNWETIAEVLLPDGTVALMGVADELWRVVAEHAPHLARAVCKRVRPDVVEVLLARSKADGKPAAPGMSLVKPSGSVSVLRAKGCGAALERLIAAKLLTWDGRPMLPPAEETAS